MMTLAGGCTAFTAILDHVAAMLLIALQLPKPNNTSLVASQLH